jgi:thiamine-phosphate pyrophosphorylase
VTLPKLYAIADRSCFADANELYAFVEDLLAAGVTLIQYRDKRGNAHDMLADARELRRIVARGSSFGNTDPNHEPRTTQNRHAVLIMNDRADLALAADFDGVHVGQDDLSPQSVRKIIGPDRWLGVSTHSPEQLALADQSDATYLAIGPVFATSSKQNPDPVVGLQGVRRARELTRKPLVAIGGITCETAPHVIAAGADSVAIISALTRDSRRTAEQFLACLK